MPSFTLSGHQQQGDNEQSKLSIRILTVLRNEMKLGPNRVEREFLHGNLWNGLSYFRRLRPLKMCGNLTIIDELLSDNR